MAAIDLIYHDHVRLADQLSRVRTTARSIRDDGIVDRDRYQAVRRFIHTVAIPHLRHEETEVFPRARAMGIPEHALDFLRRDHHQLRVLARLATAWGLDEKTTILPHAAADVIERFVRAFDEHARREEALFRELDRDQHEAV